MTDRAAPRGGRRTPRIRVLTALAATVAVLGAAAGLGAAAAGTARADSTWAAAQSAAADAGQGGVDSAAEAVPLSLHQTVPSSYTFPGIAPVLPWPSSGQAALVVEGLGSLGSSGPVDTPVPIASIAKTMTSYLILRDHPLAPGQDGPTITVTAADAAVYQKEAATTDDSLTPVKAGEQLTERDALYALMLASADNVAQIVASWDAGSVPAFLAKMNAMAATLGMSHTTFTDPSGLDASTTSTAPDLIRLGEAALERADFREIVAAPKASVPVAGTIYNYDGLLGTDGVIGVKTGSTSEAGACLLFAATVTVGGQTETLVGAVLGQRLGSGHSELFAAMDAALKLVVSGEQALGTAPVAVPGTVLATVDRGTKRVTALTPAAAVTVVGWPGLGFRVSVLGSPARSSVAVSAAASELADAGSPPVAAEPLRPGPPAAADRTG